jgi:hypothetical protein
MIIFLTICLLTQLIPHPAHFNPEDGGTIFFENIGRERYVEY